MSYSPINFDTNGLANVRGLDKNSQRLPGETGRLTGAAGVLSMRTGSDEDHNRALLEWLNELQIGKKTPSDFYPEIVARARRAGPGGKVDINGA